MDIVQSMEAGKGTAATEGARRATGVAAVPVGRTLSGQVIPNSEVPEKIKRRRYTAKYKLRILREIEECSPGDRGAFLRREGLYASSLTKWREQLERGELTALAPKKRGRKADPDRALKKKLAKQELENETLKRRLRQAEMIIDVQKKVSEMLGINLDQKENAGRNK